jgi:threonine dehydrogenase-like Zn-dependent dehydrogenase
MKAIIKTKTGVKLVECAIPTLTNNHDVFIKVMIAGLCRTDMYVAQGQIPCRESIVLGHEFSGIVEDIGTGVSRIKRGDRVGVHPAFMSADGHYSMLGIDRDGAYADYINVPEAYVYPIPAQLTFEEAAFLEPIAASLAVTRAPINIMQHGYIAGKNRIAELTLRVLQEKGFKHIRQEDDMQAILPNTYDFVIETVPTEMAFNQLVQALKPRGTLLLKSRPHQSIPLPLKLIVQKEITLMGVHYGSFQEGIDLLSSGRLYVKDLLGEVYSLEEAIPILSGQQCLSDDKKSFFKPGH